MKKVLLLLLLMAVPGVMVRALHTGLSAKLVLTNIRNGLENVSQFSCSETVHGYITLPEKALGQHTLEGVWIAPTGTEVEHSKNELEFASPGRQTAYVWLAFQDKTEGLLGNFRSSQKPETSNNLYNGEWQLKVLWDGQPLVQSNFKVKCS